MRFDNVTVVTMAEVKSDAVLWNNEAWTFHATGLTRRVFVNAARTRVIKVPVHRFDYEHNRNEAESWKTLSEEKRNEFAECAILPNGWLEMEFLTTLNDPDVYEKWSHRELSVEELQFASSCRNEVGFDKDGKLKCYDYDEYRRY
jgi:hypothetical protein